jgi:homogentisate 1,2-dioxygenase
MERKNSKTYALRTSKAHNGTIFGSLTVPAEMTALVPKGTRFALEMTEEGFLYRIIQPTDAAVERPSWAVSDS